MPPAKTRPEDQFLFHLLQRVGALEPEEVATIAEWWRELRSNGRSLGETLSEQGILSREASARFAESGRGRPGSLEVWPTTPERIFEAEGIARLRRKLSEFRQRMSDRPPPTPPSPDAIGSQAAPSPIPDGALREGFVIRSNPTLDRKPTTDAPRLAPPLARPRAQDPPTPSANGRGRSNLSSIAPTERMTDEETKAAANALREVLNAGRRESRIDVSNSRPAARGNASAEPPSAFPAAPTPTPTPPGDYGVYEAAHSGRRPEPIPAISESGGANWGSSNPDSSDPRVGGLGVGSMLGKYLITDRIGQGGFGLVYLALNTTLNVPVALKLLRAEALADPKILEEFKTEAHALARLSHPNVVRVMDFEDGGDAPHLVLEYVDGISMGELISKSGRLRLDRALNLLIQATRGLESASNLGIVHRDVKPANILVNRHGIAKITDFGLAMLADPGSFGSGSPHAPKDARDKAKGTAYYMSPEQAADMPIDLRSDIYSLGVTFYQAVTDQLPINGKTRMEILINHSTQTPPPPHHVVPGLCPEVSDVILRMLAKAPEQRYQTYAELLADLESLERLASRNKVPGASDSSKLPARRPAWKTLLRQIDGKD